MLATNTESYHISKEDVKWLSYLGVHYYSSHESNFWEKTNQINRIESLTLRRHKKKT